MELNFTCINGEISGIICNKRKYDPYIVLVCLVMKDSLCKVAETGILNNEFITYLKFMRDYIECQIDFELLECICNNMTPINMIDYSDLFNSNLSFSISSSSDDLENKITKMLHTDLITINKMSDNDVYIKAKNIFNIIDKDDDGIISAKDLLLTIDNNNDESLDEEFMTSAINLLTSVQFSLITFDVFFDNFF